MPAIHEQYSEELRAEFDYLSSWLPNTHLELGDVGRLHRDRFERLTSLADLGIGFAVRERERGVDLDYSSAAEVAVSTDVDGGPLARVAVSFSRRHGIVFQARSCRISEIADREALGRRVLDLAAAGRWPAAQVVVTEVVATGPAVILVSQQQGASVDLAASAEALSGTIPLASASAGLSIVGSKGVGVKVIAPDGLTPLFRVSGVRPRLFGRKEFGGRGPAGSTVGGPAEGRTAEGRTAEGRTAESRTAESHVFAELTYEDVGA
ncbi:hypothetical protein ACFY2K_16755 [Kitasatospora sp. NPDC001309]|uniref:hypothetical protein n=1 Tax=unclassified Kitasatospora TaxID=2633591 RepID=UPI003674F1A5